MKFTTPNFSDSIFRSNLLIGFISIFTAFLIFFADLIRNNKLSLNYHSYISSFLIGSAQSLAMIPGFLDL